MWTTDIFPSKALALQNRSRSLRTEIVKISIFLSEQQQPNKKNQHAPCSHGECSSYKHACVKWSKFSWNERGKLDYACSNYIVWRGSYSRKLTYLVDSKCIAIISNRKKIIQQSDCWNWSVTCSWSKYQMTSSNDQGCRIYIVHAFSFRVMPLVRWTDMQTSLLPTPWLLDSDKQR